jgi:hypothetical protein
MHNGLFTAETKLAVSGREQEKALRAVIAYDDVTAGKQAMQLLSSMNQHLTGEAEIEVIPWSFPLLSDETWGKLAGADAAKADILIIATTGLHPFPLTVLNWVESIIDQLRETDAAIVSLQCQEEIASGSAAACHEAIRNATRQAGLAYFATVMQFNQQDIFKRMQQRADMVTPVLDKIMHQQTSLQATEEKN